MTPKSRDRNMTRVRRITGAVAGAALAACGLFAGLAASATQKAYSRTTTATTTTAKKHTQATTTAATTTTVAPVTVAPVIVTPTQSAPVANSGGS